MPGLRKGEKQERGGNRPYFLSGNGPDLRNIILLLFFIFAAVSIGRNPSSSNFRNVGLAAETGGKQIVYVDSCQTLFSPNTEYLVTKDLPEPVADCLVVYAHDVTVNCQGHTLALGTGKEGVIVHGSWTGVSIKNCRFEGQKTGASQTSAKGVLLRNGGYDSQIFDNTFVSLNYGIMCSGLGFKVAAFRNNMDQVNIPIAPSCGLEQDDPPPIERIPQLIVNLPDKPINGVVSLYSKKKLADGSLEIIKVAIENVIDGVAKFFLTVDTGVEYAFMVDSTSHRRATWGPIGLRQEFTHESSYLLQPVRNDISGDSGRIIFKVFGVPSLKPIKATLTFRDNYGNSLAKETDNQGILEANYFKEPYSITIEGKRFLTD